MPVLSRAPKERQTIQTPTWDLWLTNLVTAVNEATAAIGGPAAAGTLTGTTLAANVVTSSLTSVGTLVNLTVTNPITGSVTGSSGSTSGNAATATALQTPRAINGVNFDGTAAITVTAAAGTLTGATLAANVLASSLTSVGTLTGGATGAGFTIALGTSTITGVLATARGGTSVDIASAALPLGSGQVTFPATQNASSNANTLDDYEEGTWTPTDASGAGLAFTNVIGAYLKIGQLVHVEGKLVFPATASGAAMNIGGLPFTSRNNGDQIVAMTIAYTTGNGGVAFRGLIANNGTTWSAFNLAGTVNITNANMSGADLRFSGAYRAAA